MYYAKERLKIRGRWYRAGQRIPAAPGIDTLVKQGKVRREGARTDPLPVPIATPEADPGPVPYVRPPKDTRPKGKKKSGGSRASSKQKNN